MDTKTIQPDTSRPDNLDAGRVADVDQAHEAALAEAVVRERQERADSMADGLLALAAMIQTTPTIVDYFGVSRKITVPAYGESADDLAVFVRAALSAGATVDKKISDELYNIAVRWGSVEVEMLAWRAEVCEKVVTGVETVTEEVPDPEALAAVPTITRTREVETFEWVCKPLLAAAAPCPCGKGAGCGCGLVGEQAVAGTAVAR